MEMEGKSSLLIFILGLEKIANGVAKDGGFEEDFLFVDTRVSCMYFIYRPATRQFIGYACVSKSPRACHDLF
jgi:hypothetical protein